MFTHVEYAGGGGRGVYGGEALFSVGRGLTVLSGEGAVGGGESGEDFKLQISQILQTFLQILYM